MGACSKLERGTDQDRGSLSRASPTSPSGRGRKTATAVSSPFFGSGWWVEIPLACREIEGLRANVRNEPELYVAEDTEMTRDTEMAGDPKMAEDTEMTGDAEIAGDTEMTEDTGMAED